MQLAAYGMGCRPDTRPEHVSAEVIDAMGWHPVIGAGEQLVTSPATDPELYYLRGDAKACAEVEAWLRPLLTSQREPLLGQIVEAFGHGSVAIVMDYVVKTLAFQQAQAPAEPTEAEPTPKPTTFTRTLVGHAHYGRSHALFPADTQLRVENDRLLGVLHGGQEYGGEDLEDPGRVRAFLAVWRPQFGRWMGRSARRVAFKDWIEEGMCRLWEIRYIERGVDLPRVGYAPEGDITIGGAKVPATKLLRAQLMALRNGSAMALPSTLGADNQPKWKVDFPTVPPRHEIFKYAVDSRGARMLLATLCPADLNKANEEQFMDSVQRVCDFGASTLTRIVNTVMRLRYGDRAPFVQVLANDIPKRKLKIATEVFKTVASATQRLPDGRVYTLAELIDPEIIDQIGQKRRPIDEAAHAPVAAPASLGPPGRPGDVTSDREERRELSKTVEGESDTGGKNVEREERD